MSPKGEKMDLLEDRKPNTPPIKQWTLFHQKVWELFIKPGEGLEVRILKAYGRSEAWGNSFANGTVSGYFDNHHSFSEACKKADKISHGGIYFTLQVIDPRLIGRAFNRLRISDRTTSDRDVLSYRWLPIDLDPVRPSGISSSDSELKVALELRDIVADWIVKETKFPKPIKAMSGNGGHILRRLPDLPANEQMRTSLKDYLEGLAQRFNTDRIKIDTSVHNPARIWKIYGTTARKGDPVPAGLNREARPFRMAYIDDLGE
jgi:hypothetical protein